MTVLEAFDTGLIRGLHHVELTVADLSRSIAFYESLGLKLRMRWAEGPDLCAEGFGVPGADIELAQLDGYGITLELIEFASPEGAKKSAPMQDAGTAHLAFTVKDIFELHAALTAAGADVVSEPIREQSANWMQIVDPDGIRVEFIAPNGDDVVPIGAVVS